MTNTGARALIFEALDNARENGYWNAKWSNVEWAADLTDFCDLAGGIPLSVVEECVAEYRSINFPNSTTE